MLLRIEKGDLSLWGELDDARHILLQVMKGPGGYPYVFIPAKRYDYIQNLRQQGKPAPTDRNKLITNFSRTFGQILKKAGVRHREFHDLRSTAITNWLYNGLKEHEVMRLAGHSSFETTHRFYLAVQPDLYERARQANAATMGESLARIRRAPGDSRKIGVGA